MTHTEQHVGNESDENDEILERIKLLIGQCSVPVRRIIPSRVQDARGRLRNDSDPEV